MERKLDPNIFRAFFKNLVKASLNGSKIIIKLPERPKVA